VHLAAGRLGDGQRTAAALGRGRPDQPLVPGWIVVSAAVAAPPKHKQNPGTARERAKRAKAHAQHRAHKQGRTTTPPSATAQRYAQTWVLFTTAPTVAQAVAEYAQRMPIEETFRDWHHGWGVRAAVVKLPTAVMVDRKRSQECHEGTNLAHMGRKADHAHIAVGASVVATHLITSSAWKRRVGGIVSPRAWAVLRSMISSNFIGCNTGRSAGLAPFRSLST